MAMFRKNWPSIIGNCVRVMQQYRNWPEVIASLAGKQVPSRLILKDGTLFEVDGGFQDTWRGQIEYVFFERAYLPKPLHIRSDDVVIDIGANIGVFAIFAASLTRNKVYAFEPFPSNCEILTHLLAINNLTNVILQRAAVSDRVGSATLQISSISGTRHFLANPKVLQTLEDYQKKSEHLRFADVMPGELNDTLEIPTITLQEFMDRNRLGKVGFLKLNCEGAEGAIILATPNEYLKRIRQIFVHFHVHLSDISPSEMQKRLKEAGFTVVLQWDGVSPLGHMYGWRS